MTKRFVVAALLTLACAPLFGQSPSAGEPELRKRWEALSPEKRENLLKTWKRYQSLPETRKSELRARFERIRSLPPEERTRLERKWEAFRSMPEGKKLELKNTWRSLPAAERTHRVEAIHKPRPEAPKAPGLKRAPPAKEVRRPKEVERPKVSEVKPIKTPPKATERRKAPRHEHRGSRSHNDRHDRPGHRR